MQALRIGKLYRSKAEWQGIMERYRASGLTQVEFCEREGLSPTSFYKWQVKLQAAATAKQSFMELPTKLPGDTWRVELELGDGLTLRLR